MGDMYDTIEMILKDYVKKDDLRNIALQYKEVRDHYWKSNLLEFRKRGDVYDTIYCEIMELLDG